MFYMLMMLMVLMKFSFVPQHFYRFFFQDQDHDHDQDQDFNIEFIKKSYALNTKDSHKIWCRTTKFFLTIKILVRIRIRITIMILLWISIPDLYFIHRRHPPNFVRIR